MNNNVVHFESLRVQGLLLTILGVVLPQDDGDLAQLGPVDTVGRCGNVPVVQQHTPALVTADTNVSLPWQLRELGLLTANNSL